MTLVGFRIDDRLMHGQVVENWVGELRPDLVLVANARAAADPLTRALYAAALPPGVALEVVPVEDATAAAAAGAARVLLIVGSPADALRLVEAGLRPAVVTVGGLHHVAGKERLLDFVYVDEEDREALRRLAARGLPLAAQDVPRRQPRDLAALLGG
jgi:mannose/fructose/N-acetylgalactosamine-specific phosphotransferase system component IIB